MNGRGRSHSFSAPTGKNVPRPRANSVGASTTGLPPIGPPPIAAPPPAIARSDANRVVVGTFLTHHGQEVNPGARGGRTRAMSVRQLTGPELIDAANPLHPKGNSLTPPERGMAARETQHRADALLIGAAIHLPGGGAATHQSHGPAHPPHIHGSSAVAAPDAPMIRMGRYGQSFVDAAFRGNPGAGDAAIVPSAMKQMGVARSTAGGAATYGVATSGSPGSPDGQTINGRLTAALTADRAVDGYPGAPLMTVLGAADPSPGIAPVANRLVVLPVPGIPAGPNIPYNAATGQAFVRGAAAVPPILAQAAVAAVAERKACAALNSGFAANVLPVAGGARVDPRAAAVAATPLTPEIGTQGQMLYEAILNPTGIPAAGAGLPLIPLLAPGAVAPPIVLKSGLPLPADNYTTIARSHPSTVAAAVAESALGAPLLGTRPRSQSLSAMTESCRNCLTGVNH